MFYGLPIHIMRDLFITARSFLKRLTAFLRYRRATRDMNEKYEDATVEDIQREDTCIICREEMRPWSVTNPHAPPVAPGAMPPARPATTVNERTRPKKLPCGHILHLGCLKSWLERQQVCPTCRRPVVDSPAAQAAGGAANANVAGQGPQRALPGQQDGADPQAPARPPVRGMRVLNFGPLRVGFGQANLQDLQNMGAPQAGQDNAGGPRAYGLEGLPQRNQPQQAPNLLGNVEAAAVPEHLQQIEQQIVAEIRSLQVTQQELQLVQLLQAELARLRLIQNGGADPLAANFQIPPMPQLGPLGSRHAPSLSTNVPHMQRHGVRPNTAAILAGSAELPPGVTIPEGWSLLPLQRLDSVAPLPQTVSVVTGSAAGLAPTATTQPIVSPMTSGTSNNTLTPTPTTNPENQSQTPSVDSSDSNAIHTPPSVMADQSSIGSSSITNPSTSTSSDAPVAPNMQGESSTLPNWGSGQLFADSSRNTSTNERTSSSATFSPPTTIEGEAPMYRSPLATIPSSTLSGTPSHDDDERREGKGKAKAVTLEDAEDEAEGS
jgi:E3 ubiquitin-protein ligase synoviolin